MLATQANQRISLNSNENNLAKAFIDSLKSETSIAILADLFFDENQTNEPNFNWDGYGNIKFDVIKSTIEKFDQVHHASMYRHNNDVDVDNISNQTLYLLHAKTMQRLKTILKNTLKLMGLNTKENLDLFKKEFVAQLNGGTYNNADISIKPNLPIDSFMGDNLQVDFNNQLSFEITLMLFDNNYHIFVNLIIETKYADKNTDTIIRIPLNIDKFHNAVFS